MNPSEVNSYLESFVNFESQLHKLRPEDFDLNRIQKFLDLAGIPINKLKVVHVAGTKGKGSTCAFLGSILQQAGYKIGLYTSPHLNRVNERIRVLGVQDLKSKDDFSGVISDDEIGSIVNVLRPLTARILNEGGFLTYFEVLTVVALSHFINQKVDIAILETGLGGRLDATNVVDSCVAVITPVSLDHTKILGSTLHKIAVEKAGIIKNSRQKVVIAPQESQVMELLLARCREFGIQPILVSVGKYTELKIGLKGKHQMINAAAAMEAVGLLKKIGFKINDAAISEGLKNVRWPGRFEVVRQNPDVIVDCAHNEASAQALSLTLKEEYPHRRIILVLGISQDKDVRAICRHLKNDATHIFLTKARHSRAYLFTEAEGKDCFSGKPFEIVEDVGQALEKALKRASPQDVILVTGSIFVVAEARNCLGEFINSVPPTVTRIN